MRPPPGYCSQPCQVLFLATSGALCVYNHVQLRNIYATTRCSHFFSEIFTQPMPKWSLKIPTTISKQLTQLTQQTNKCNKYHMTDCTQVPRHPVAFEPLWLYNVLLKSVTQEQRSSPGIGGKGPAHRECDLREERGINICNNLWSAILRYVHGHENKNWTKTLIF